MAKIQVQMDNIKFPHTVDRKYLKITNFNQWKASEVKLFFFYVGLPILKHYLKAKYVLNLSCIVHGILF